MASALSRVSASSSNVTKSFKIGNNKKAFTRKNRVGAFRSLPAAQLNLPIFQSTPPLPAPSFKPEVVTENTIGTVFAFDETKNDPIKHFGTPKSMLLEYRLLSQRYSVIRDITVITTEELEEAALEPSHQSNYVLTGPTGCGKSFVLLQAVQYCLAKEWVVIYIPRAKTLVNSTTMHTYDLRTRTYFQPKFAQQLLQRTLDVNSKVLETMTMREGVNFDRRSFPAGTTLAALAAGGAKEQAISSVAFETLIGELCAQSKIPILLAIDDFQALYTPKSSYRDPHFSAIRPYHLALPRILLELASGKRFFQRGAVLGALTTTDPKFPVTQELKEVLELPIGKPRSAYGRRSRVLEEYAEGCMNLPVPEQFSVKEAAAVFEMWMKDQALTAPANDEVFLSKYTESGGNPKAFVWQGILGTLEGASPEDVDESVPWPQLREGRVPLAL
ncbi:mitochondrial ribosomal death-associated protein 3-domain-containing protein [Rhodocollybia butyracea]|uniref:Small ribosomal subunit protein mS29 n=1 Tax=Rhodocollybia butyracea TaxID=206335 RepID=A0A9P5PWX0_9AGAR|nr:mitochondrial ribosomal death-associated protein 3-domain-containing protein [Rhodocollybia butyracea]